MPKSNTKLNTSAKKNTDKIYLDYASSALAQSANPGAIHSPGVKEKNKLENARAVVAGILNAQADEIIFTSGATESNNLAILGLVQNFLQDHKLPHIVTTNIEHASVLEVCKHLEKIKQAKVTYVPVETNGVVDPRKIKKALTKNTVLVSVMYANNEIGTIQPLRDIAKEIRHYNKINTKKARLAARQVFFHTDATQAVNYLPVKAPFLGVDLMSLNSAKIYGPKGVGVLYVKRKTPIEKIMWGGEQERGLRPGTENVLGVLEFTKAFQITEKIKEKEIKRLTELRDYFIDRLRNKKESFAELIINGDLKNRLPNNINITIPKIPSDLLVIELSARGIMASSKSACKSGDIQASHVIEAINPKAKETDGSLRFSLGRETTRADIDFTVKALSQILIKLKKWYN